MYTFVNILPKQFSKTEETFVNRSILVLATLKGKKLSKAQRTQALRPSNQLMILCSTSTSHNHTIFCSWHGNTRKNLGSNKNARIWLFYLLGEVSLELVELLVECRPRQSMLAIWAQMERGTITVIVNTRLGAIRPRIRSAPHNLIANALPGLDAMQWMAISWSLTKTGSFVEKLLVEIATNFQRHGETWKAKSQMEFVNICTSKNVCPH